MLDIKMTDSMFYDCKTQYLAQVSRYASRGIVLDGGNNIAMMHLVPKGTYKLPGGGLEQGESKEQAFIREVKEETGYDCEILQELGIVEEHKNRNGFLQYSFCFIGRIVGSRQNTQLTEHEQRLGFELSWMSLDEAIAHMDRALRKLNTYSENFMLAREKTILEYGEKWLREA